MRFLLIAFIAATAVACSDASNAPATASAEKAPSAAPGDHAGEGVKARGAGKQVHALQFEADPRVQGDQRLVRGTRAAGVTVHEVQSGHQDRAPAQGLLTCTTIMFRGR